MAGEDQTAGGNVKIKLAGAGEDGGGEKGTVPPDHFQGFIVEKDMFQPDMASIVLMNQGDIYSKTKIGGDVEIMAGDGDKSVFKGQVVGLEPIFKGGEKSRIVIRCLSKMHLLLRKRKSRTWQECSESDVLNKVVSDVGGLSLEFAHDKAASIKYKHVYQHNQTDLEFLRVRAARLGCHVWCEDTKLMVKKPDLGQTCGVTLKVDESSKDAALQSFTPRLSSTQIVNKVTVRGWNPETKELIEGTASAQSSSLGSQNASAGSGDLGKEETFTVDHPIWSKEEATVLATARLQDLSLTYITGEAQIHGINDQVKLGKSLTVEANTEGADDPFNGNYYIMGITYKNMPSMQDKASKKDVAHTTVRLARDAQKK